MKSPSYRSLPCRLSWWLALAWITGLAIMLLPTVAGAEVIRFESADGQASTVRAQILRPEGEGPFPAVVAMHGCGGLYNTRGRLKPRSADWGARLRDAGYVVVFPDSFGSRGQGKLCTVVDRPVSQTDRVADAFGAAKWLAAQPEIDARRLALIGWSNGGTTVLWTAAHGADGGADFRSAIAFYPWCRDVEDMSRPSSSRFPLTILIGGADNWTPPKPCTRVAKKWKARIVVYPGAYHDFDAPGMQMQELTGTALSADGKGIVRAGTQPAARAAAIAEVMKTLKEELRGPGDAAAPVR